MMMPLVVNVIFVTGFLAQLSTQENKISDKVSQGTWSEDLTRRLSKHSCKAGNIQRQTTLLHKLKSGTFIELGHVTDLEVCVLQCCESKHCELALFKNNFCYGITCYSAQHCKTVPAYDDEKADAVFLTKANLTKQGTPSSQSEDRKPIQKTADFVFYPSDSSSDLAFSVNLRNIAKHYIHDEKVRNVLTAKANEHLNGKRESISQNNIKIMSNDGHFKGSEQNLGWAEIKNKNVSELDKFLSRNHPRLSQGTAQSGKRSETFHKPKKQESTKTVEWGPRLLKVFVPSSSVAILIVLVALLAMSRRKEK